MAEVSGGESRCPACGARVFAARPGLAVCTRCDALLGIEQPALPVTTDAPPARLERRPSVAPTGDIARPAPSDVDITEYVGGTTLEWAPVGTTVPWWVLLPVVFSCCLMPYSLVLWLVPIGVALAWRRPVELRLERDRLVAHLGPMMKLVMERGALGEVHVVQVARRRRGGAAWCVNAWDERRQRWVSLGDVRSERAADAIAAAISRWRDGRSTP